VATAASVDVGNAFDWLRQGWATFIVNPGTWIAMMVITDRHLHRPGDRPLIGQLAAHLLTPVLAAGMLVACSKVRPAKKRWKSPTFSPVSSAIPAR
jgi:hypothetical protein